MGLAPVTIGEDMENSIESSVSTKMSDDDNIHEGEWRESFVSKESSVVNSFHRLPLESFAGTNTSNVTLGGLDLLEASLTPSLLRAFASRDNLTRRHTA